MANAKCKCFFEEFLVCLSERNLPFTWLNIHIAKVSVLVSAIFYILRNHQSCNCYLPSKFGNTVFLSENLDEVWITIKTSEKCYLKIYYLRKLSDKFKNPPLGVA